MKAESRSNAYAAMGLIAVLLGSYSIHKTSSYWSISGDLFGTVMFGLAGAALFLVACAHFMMAFGFRFGQVEAVKGRRERATIVGKRGVIANDVKILVVRMPSFADSHERLVFFIAGGRPWVCPESKFLQREDLELDTNQ